jgi:antirestriction protein ArdC
MLAQTALKYDVEVNKDGQVELTVPFPVGAHVTVFVVDAGDGFADLLYASQSSLEFWNNPLDDEDWNNA